MNKRIWLLSVVLLSGPAVAQQAYFGVGAGQSDVDELDETGTAVRVFAGANLSPNLAIEVGLVDMGSVSVAEAGDSVDFDAASLYGAAVGKLPLGSITLYGKAGLHYWGATVGAQVSGFHGSGEDNGIDPMFGVGVEVPVNSRLGLRAEFERYQNVADGLRVDFPGAGVYAVVDGTDVDVFTVAATYSF